jgi:hypothetical protein
MYQKDYILRMVEMLGQMIAAILGLIKKGELQIAQKSIDEAYLQMLRKDAKFFENISVDELTTKLLEDHNYTNHHLEILAELQWAEAEMQFAKKDYQGSLAFYEKSLCLFEFVEKEGKTYSEERLAKMKQIRDKITDFNANPPRV